MPPEDDFRRDRDPRTRANAIVAAVLAAAGLAALTGVLVARSQPTASAPVNTPFARPSAPSLAPTPVPGLPVLGSSFSAAYDSRSHQLVAFGGVDSGDQTWIWNGHSWRLARPRVSPPGRFAAAIAYDPAAGVVLLYAGRLIPGQLVNDTWAWDGNTWRQVDAGTGNPPSGEGSVMAWDDSTSQMVLVAGHFGADAAPQTWTWSGSRWQLQAGGAPPASTFLIGMAVDPVTRQLLGVSCCSQGSGETITIAWDGSAWHQLSTGTMPGFTVSMVSDPVSARILMFSDPSIAAEVWSWSGQDWLLQPNLQVPVFPTVAMVDTDTHRVVIIGSIAEPVQGSPQPVQLWTLIGSSWQQLS